MSNTFLFDDDEDPNLRSEADSGADFSGDDGGGEEEEGSNNRTFMIVAIVFGGLVLLSLICMAVYALLVLPRQREAQQAAEATSQALFAEATSVAQLTQEAALFTATATATDIFTPTATVTPLVVFATETPAALPTSDPATATVEALQTQLANTQLTATLMPTPTALSQTGFADEVGLPLLVISAIVLVFVIFFSRRLRNASI
jgi:cytoskeletal protein RodZ